MIVEVEELALKIAKIRQEYVGVMEIDTKIAKFILSNYINKNHLKEQLQLLRRIDDKLQMLLIDYDIW